MYLEDFVVSHVSCESGERLSSTAAHPYQEGVAPGLLDDTTDAAHMLNRKPGRDKDTV